MLYSAPTIRFQATLSPEGEGRVLVVLHQDVAKKLDAPEQTEVEGTIAGFPFRSPLEKCTRLKISEALQKATGAGPGSTVTVEITRVGDEPEVRMPPDLKKALATSPQARALWEDITPMARREWVRWVASAKQEETRARRIEVGIDKLLHGMRRPCCFPGLNFVTKGLVPPEDTWTALPGQKAKV